MPNAEDLALSWAMDAQPNNPREKDQAAVALGKKGGLSTAARRSPAERREAARRAALCRWGKAYVLLEEAPPPAWR